VTPKLKPGRNAAIYTWRAHPDDAGQIRWHGDGHLVCTEGDCYGEAGRVNWCEHIEALVRSGEDSIPFWNGTLEDFNLEYVFIQVPMMPSHDLWTAVQFSETKSPDMLMASMRRDVAPSDIINLGFCSAGEGRLALRSLVKETFDQFWLENPSEECVSKMHNMVGQRAWTNAKKQGGNAWFLERWLVWQTGGCRTCFLGSMAPGDHTDLVPF